MATYYNEHDKFMAQWLRNMIEAKLIAPGDVDERSIEDVKPIELAGYRQVHLFAGLGGWSYALRCAGVPDDEPIWSMSCPCQPFSAAGEGAGFADERHLWPAGFHLIGQCKPARIVGEQVASKDAQPWIDLVQDDLEALGYAFGAIPFPAASIGCPGIRDRLYWMANAASRGLGERRCETWPRDVRHLDSGGDASSLLGNAGNAGLPARELAALVGAGRRQEGRAVEQPGRASGGLAHAERERHDGLGSAGSAGSAGQWRADAAGCSPSSQRLADADGWDAGAERELACGQQRLHAQDDVSARSGSGGGQDRSRPELAGPGPVNGYWRSADWLHCRDGKWRPVEPGSSPLAYGLAASMGALSPEQGRLAGVARLDGASLARAKRYRTGSLRGYGNAINAEQAIAFIEAVTQSIP
jgi:DNA (cytosine-5)-methyltransferase 1